MDGANQVPLEIERLTPQSKLFLQELLAWQPDWLKYCLMDESPDGCDLRVTIPSPSNKPERLIHVWYAINPHDISLGFGPWHTHENVQIGVGLSRFYEFSILDGIKLIISGEISYYGRAPDFQPFTAAYLSDPDSILDLVTDPHSNGAIRLFFWDESKDCEFSTQSKHFSVP